MKKIFKIVFVVMMIFVVVISSIPLSAFAADGEANQTQDEQGGGNLAQFVAGCIIAARYTGVAVSVASAAVGSAFTFVRSNLPAAIYLKNRIDAWRLKSISQDIKNSYGFTDDALSAASSVPVDNTIDYASLPEVDSLASADWSYLDEVALCETFDFPICSTEFTYYSDIAVGNPSFVGPYLYNQVNFYNGVYYDAVVSPKYGGFRVTVTYHLNGHDYKFSVMESRSETLNYQNCSFKLYNPVKVINANGQYEIYLPCQLRTSYGNYVKGWSQLGAYDNHGLSCDSTRGLYWYDGSYHILDAAPTSSSHFAYEMLFGGQNPSVFVDTPVELGDDGVFTNTDTGATYNPIDDNTLIVPAISEEVDNAVVSFPNSRILVDTAQSYIDQVNAGVEPADIVLPYSDVVINSEIDRVIEDTTVETPDIPVTSETINYSGLLGGIKSLISDILDWLSSIWNLIKSIPSYIQAIPNSISSAVDRINYFFNPNHPDFNNNFGDFFRNLLSQKFISVQSFLDSFDDLNNTNNELVIDHDLNIGGYVFHLHVDLGFFESHRLQIRGGIAVIFWLCLLLAQVRSFLSIFGLPSTHIYMDPYGAHKEN